MKLRLSADIRSIQAKLPVAISVNRCKAIKFVYLRVNIIIN